MRVSLGWSPLDWVTTGPFLRRSIEQRAAMERMVGRIHLKANGGSVVGKKGTNACPVDNGAWQQGAKPWHAMRGSRGPACALHWGW